MKRACPTMYLIYFLDIIILNACCITIAYSFLQEMDWLWGMLAFNNVAVIALRQWIYRIMGTNWLASPLNRTLKRLADIVCSLFFLLTAFPVILIVHLIYHHCSKEYRSDATLGFHDVQTTDGLIFSAAVIKPQIIKGSTVLNHTPIVFNILAGTISMWDIPSLEFTDWSCDTEETAKQQEKHTPEGTAAEEDLPGDTCPAEDCGNQPAQEPTLFDNQQENDEHTKETLP